METSRIKKRWEEKEEEKLMVVCGKAGQWAGFISLDGRTSQRPYNNTKWL